MHGQEEYCPIRNEDGKCGAGKECNHTRCWEKMHYFHMPDGLRSKIDKWIRVKREDYNRWEQRSKTD